MTTRSETGRARTARVRAALASLTVVGTLIVAPLSASATNVPPLISLASLSSPTLSPAGGTETLTTHVSGATTCSLVFVPTLPSGPDPWNCSGVGTVTHVSFWMPPNAASAAVVTRVTFTAKGTYADGTSIAISKVLSLSRKGYDFYVAQHNLATPNTPTSISCPTSVFCAESFVGGFVGTFNGSGRTIIHLDATTDVNAVSCISGPPVECLAVDAAGRVMSYNGTTWSTPTAIAPGVTNDLVGVTCNQSSISGNTGATCVVVASGTGSGFSSWGYFVHGHLSLHFDVSAVDLVTGSPAVSCWVSTVSAKNCATLLRDGHVLVWGGKSSSWSDGGSLFSDGGSSEGAVTSLHCSSDGVCQAGDAHGGVTTFRPDALPSSRVRLSVSSAALVSITCIQDVYCLAGDNHGGLFQGVSGTQPLSMAWAAVPQRIKVQFPWLASCSGDGHSHRPPMTCTALGHNFHMDHDATASILIKS